MRLAIVTTAAIAAAFMPIVFSSALADSANSTESDHVRNHDTQAPDLGIVIKAAGNTHVEVQQFLAALHPDTRRAVLEGCRYYLRTPVGAQPTTISFCKLAL